MQEQEYTISGGSLYYEKHPREIIVTRLQGLQSSVMLPGEIEDLPVTAVARKAFLSKKYLHNVKLPASIREVGDWAFAYCSHLEWVAFSDADIHFGKAVFLDCHGLEEIRVEGKGADVAALLAAAAREQVGYLMNLREAGSREWLQQWDLWMISVLHRPDKEGYSKQVLCGEEDYGSTDLNAYIQGKRKEKVRLCLLRLVHSQGLGNETKEELETYLLTHTKGCESEESWQVIREEYGEKRAYYQKFASLGCLTESNLADILEDIGDAYPEMKAYFLSCKEEQLGYSDFFGDLEL